MEKEEFKKELNKIFYFVGRNDLEFSPTTIILKSSGEEGNFTSRNYPSSAIPIFTKRKYVFLLENGESINHNDNLVVKETYTHDELNGLLTFLQRASNKSHSPYTKKTLLSTMLTQRMGREWEQEEGIFDWQKQSVRNNNSLYTSLIKEFENHINLFKELALYKTPVFLPDQGFVNFPISPQYRYRLLKNKAEREDIGMYAFSFDEKLRNRHNYNLPHNTPQQKYGEVYQTYIFPFSIPYKKTKEILGTIIYDHTHKQLVIEIFYQQKFIAYISYTIPNNIRNVGRTLKDFILNVTPNIIHLHKKDKLCE